MITNNTKTLVRTVGVGKLLFSSIASAVGKSSLGYTYLNLDMMPVQNVTMCHSPADAATIKPGSLSPANVTIVSPLVATTGQISFSVGNILPNSQGYVVYLAYSPFTDSTPAIDTPLSTYPLALNISTLQILAAYSVPATGQFTQAVTSIGQAQPMAAEKLVFTVDLSSDSIAKLVNSGTTHISLQALIVPATDFSEGSFANAILSPVNTISFAASCPSTYISTKTDANGGKTTSSGGANVSKTSTGKTSGGSGKTNGDGTTGKSN